MSYLLLEIMKSLMLAMHLLAVSLAAAGPVFCVLLSWLSDAESQAYRIGKRLAWLSVGGFLLGMLLGGLTLFLPPDQGYWDVLRKIPTKEYGFAAAELLFSLICLVAYASTWSSLRNHRLWHSLIALLTVTNLLYHFPPLMIVIGQLADGSALLTAESLDRAALMRLMLHMQVVAPWLHFLLATVTVAGSCALHLLSTSQEVDRSADDLVRPVIAVGRIVLAAVVLQIPIGLWLVTTISQASRAAIMGKSTLASLTFLAAMLLAFLLVGRLVKIALGEFDKEDLRRAALWTLLVVLAMATSMRCSRYHGPEREAVNRKQMGHSDQIVVARISSCENVGWR